MTERQLPAEAEVLKQVCRPVVRIQRALENIEQELTASENNEELFAKVIEIQYNTMHIYNIKCNNRSTKQFC